MEAIPDFIFVFSLFCLITHHKATAISVEHPHKIRANESDYHALLAIKAEISNDPNSVLRSWSNNSLHFCLWEGVTCGHRHRRVVGLDLSSSNLGGKLSPFVGNLSFLGKLNLSNNFFRGDIPHQISHLPRLRVLALKTNSFEGVIPTNLSRCLNLRILNLGDNKLMGIIPSELTSLPKLVEFTLSSNSLTGQLEAIGIGNMSLSLKRLYLFQNHLEGSIPRDIGRLKSLTDLVLGNNTLSGIIPSSLFNLSNLEQLFLSNTRIHGNLSQDLGLCLPQLRYLILSNTSLTGHVPATLSNLSQLQVLDISINNFIGQFSIKANNMPHLARICMESAFSLGGEVRDLSFLDTLINCTNLVDLLLGDNSFIGIFPRYILNLSNTLINLDLHGNQLSGWVPSGLGKFVNLHALDLEQNHFSGPVPADIVSLESLEFLYFSFNNFSGEIPSSLGNLTRLNVLNMRYNNLEGSLPRSLGKCQSLQEIYLSSNKFSGALPVELFRVSSLLFLVIDQNLLQGSLPVEISYLKNLVGLVVSHNRFSGEIPSTLGDCKTLNLLDLSQNSFVGSIPGSLNSLKSMIELDLSCNYLSGEIPSYFSTWPYLQRLNLSFNALEGEVPANGVFANTSVVSVVGNNKLCGGVPGLHLPRCPSHRESKKRRLSLAKIMSILIACVMVVVISITLCFYFLCSSRKSKDISSGLHDIRQFLEVSYQTLSRATNGFSSSSLIGVGGFGSVYKGILHQDDTELVVAVKVMNLHNGGASKNFIAECKALRNIRHRNLVKIITACSSIDTQRNDFKALVYEFMPRGNLDSWLHSNLFFTGENVVDNNQPSGLSLFQRLSIAIDVACALEYLHVECANPIIHCDLKPTNVLLDDEMTAHISDFGLAKFVSGASTSSTVSHTSSSQVRGTIGYAAPEYGLGSRVSPEGDMYSFGIVVLEMMTSKKPTDALFNDGLNLHDFAKSTLPFPSRVMEIIDHRMLGDANLLPARTGADIKKMEAIKSLILIGVQCSLELPQERMGITDAINELKSAKQNLLYTRA